MSIFDQITFKSLQKCYTYLNIRDFVDGLWHPSLLTIVHCALLVVGGWLRWPIHFYVNMTRDPCCKQIQQATNDNKKAIALQNSTESQKPSNEETFDLYNRDRKTFSMFISKHGVIELGKKA